MKDHYLEKIAEKIPSFIKKTDTYQKISNNHKKSKMEQAEKYYKDYYEKIKAIKDIEKGNRVFIIGTGPSIDKTNLSLLKNEKLMGVNDAFKVKEELNFDYFVMCDGDSIRENYKKILNVKTNLFLSGEAGIKYILEYEKYNKKTDIYIVRDADNKKIMSDDLVDGIGVNSSVIHVALQVAFYLGFDEVYLLGCDCDYSEHMYFDGAKKTAIPTDMYRIQQWFEDYKICKKKFEENGRKIYNATVGGKLEIFDRRKINNILGTKK